MGEGLVELADRVAAPQKISEAEISIQKPAIPGFFLAAVDLVDLHRLTVSLFRLRPSSVLRALRGRIESHRVGRLLASALSLRSFPVVLRQLQHPRPTVDPSVPPFAKK
jgi:hypothetical protein